MRLIGRALVIAGLCGTMFAAPVAAVLASEAALPARAPSRPAQEGQSLPRTSLPMQLVGVMVDSSDPSRSACLVRCASLDPRRSASHLEAGATACDLAEVREIMEGGVILRNQRTNQLELLPLKPDARAPVPEAAPPPTVAQTAPDVVSVAVPKSSVDHYLLNLPDLLTSARATPRFGNAANGQRVMDGFEIDQIKGGSVVEQMGIRNGDVILEVNGEKLDSMATVLRLFGQAQGAGNATLTVLRGTERMTFVISTK